MLVGITKETKIKFVCPLSKSTKMAAMTSQAPKEYPNKLAVVWDQNLCIVGQVFHGYPNFCHFGESGIGNEFIIHFLTFELN